VVDVDVSGPADAPALVFVHGSVVSRQIWLPQLRTLSDTFRVAAGDLPGHGGLADVPFTMAAAAASVADIVERHAGGRAMVAGLSLGGYVAIELAASRPDLVAGLVLSGCSVNFTGALGAYLKLVSALMRRGWLVQSRAQAEKKTRRLFPPALADVAEAQLSAGVFPDALGPAFAELSGRDFAGRLASYRGPGLILNGAADRAVRRGAARFAASLNPGRVELIDNAKHACNLDQPEAYNRAVRRFARDIGWGAG
jgi:pimeloyl-ACP methyl ester carboxylesterase